MTGEHEQLKMELKLERESCIEKVRFHIVKGIFWINNMLDSIVCLLLVLIIYNFCLKIVLKWGKTKC